MATTADPQPTGIQGQQSEPTKARDWGLRNDVRYRFVVDMTRGL